MTPPKKWYIDEDDAGNGYILKYEDGIAIKKPNASKALGKITSVSVGDKERYIHEGMVFKCENGKLWLGLPSFEMDKNSVSTNFAVTTAEEFVDAWATLLSDLRQPLSDFNDTPSRRNPRQPIVDHVTTPIQTSPPVTLPQQSNNRRSSRENEDPKAKRLKFIPQGIDGMIEKCKQGTMELPIKQLFKPPKESRLLRSPDPIFIKNLKDQMKKDPAAPGRATMAVLCQEVSQFNPQLKNAYQYEVLGGLHSFIAQQELHAEFPDNPFFKEIMADIYLGLTDEQALRLAQRHNETSHYVHKVTHRDMVEACRSRLFNMEGKQLDDETPEPTAEWRKSCQKAIIPEKTTKTQMDLMFFQATLSKRVWALASTVMDRYEKCELGNQRRSLDKLINKPEFKQNYLSPIRSLDEVEQCRLLELVLRGDISILELKAAGAKSKKMTCLQNLFAKLTNNDNWAQCEALYPNHATTEKLEGFLNIDLKNIPSSFKSFCSKAKLSAQASSIVHINDDNSPVQFRGAKCHVISVFSNDLLSFDLIHRHDPTFQGAALTIMKLSNDTSIDTMETLCFSMKEVNSSQALEKFTVSAICSPDIMNHVQQVWCKAFDYIDLFFYACKETRTNIAGVPSWKLIQSTWCIVLGYFTVAEYIGSDHFNYSSPKTNFMEGCDMRELVKELVLNYSYPAGTILDITGLQDLVADISLTEGRNAVTIVKDDLSRMAVSDRLFSKFA